METGRHRLPDASVGRKLLAELFCELGYKSGAEIGVDRGHYSKILLTANLELKLYLVDAWEGVRAENHYIDTQSRLKSYEERADFRKGRSLIMAKQFEDNTLDFIYIDSQRDFNAVVMDLIEWGRKVKQGGIISGRGYCHLFETGVVKAVDSYTYAHNIRDWYITRDVEPNYFFVKTWKSG